MVWGTFCIVFIRLVVIHFYPKSCNSIGVLSLFSEKSCKSAGHHVKDRRYEDWNSMVLRRYLNTIQYKWIKFVWNSKASHDGRKPEKWSKIVEFAQEVSPHAPLRTEPCALVHETTFLAASCTPAHQVMRHAHGHGQGVLFACFPSRFLWRKPYFHSLNPDVIIHYK
jgi:hypothetical protein